MRTGTPPYKRALKRLSSRYTPAPVRSDGVDFTSVLRRPPSATGLCGSGVSGQSYPAHPSAKLTPSLWPVAYSAFSAVKCTSTGTLTRRIRHSLSLTCSLSGK